MCSDRRQSGVKHDQGAEASQNKLAFKKKGRTAVKNFLYKAVSHTEIKHNIRDNVKENKPNKLKMHFYNIASIIGVRAVNNCHYK